MDSEDKTGERRAITLQMREALNAGAQARYFVLEKKLAELEVPK